MKKTSLFLLALLLILSGCNKRTTHDLPPSATPAVTPTATAVPTEATPITNFQKGILTEAGFESEWLNLMFTTPEGLLTANQNDLDDLMGITADVLSAKETGKNFNYTELSSLIELWCGLSHRTCVKIQVTTIPETENITAMEYLSMLSDMYSTSTDITYKPNSVTTEKFAGELYAKLEMTLYIKEELFQSQEILVRIQDNRLIQVMFSSLAGEEEIKTQLKNAFTAYMPSSATGQALSETPRGTYQKGTLTDSCFESKWMSLRFSPSHTMYMLSQEELNAAMGIDHPSTIDYTYLPSVQEMVAMTTNQTANVLVVSEPLSMDEMSLEQYLQNLKMQFHYSTGVTYSFDETWYDVEIGGNTYKTLLLEAKYQKGPHIFQAYCVRRLEDRLIVITFSWSPGYEDDISALLHCFSEY